MIQKTLADLVDTLLTKKEKWALSCLPVLQFLVKVKRKVKLMTILRDYLKVARIESWLGWVFCFGFGSIPRFTFS